MKNKRLIFLIILDAVRYDHLSIYGYKRSTTPNLEKYLGNSIIFKTAYSTSSWTPPAHASMVTGYYPHQHRVYGDNFKLKTDYKTLPGFLKSKGFKTLGVSLTPYLSRETGYAKRFNDFIEIWKKGSNPYKSARLRSRVFNVLRGSDNRTFEKLLLIKRWLSQTSGIDKRFVFVNFITAHNPYKPPRPWNSRFKTEFPKNFNRETVNRLSESGGYKFISGKLKALPQDWEMVRIRYDQEIAYLDYRLGQLFLYLKKNGLFDLSDIFIVSDHGEGFGEHNLAYHTFGLIEPLLRIPMIYKPAGFKKSVSSDRPVSLVDILPSLLGEIDDLPGKNLRNFQSISNSRTLFFEFGRPVSIFKTILNRDPDADIYKFDYNFVAARSGDYKLLIKYKKSARIEKLFNLKKDPDEKINLIDKMPEKANELRKKLEKLIQIRRNNSDGEKSKGLDEMAEHGLENRLKDLGYL